MESDTTCLSDFGLSGVVSWGVTEAFALPENRDSLTKCPSKEADIYSFDNIMFVIFKVLSGKVPYYYIKQQITEDHWSMIERCWSPSNVRPTIEDLLRFVVEQRCKHKN
ncbi:hypothetical protein BD769DRAFT_1497754 [Suillus cothurnatus]|nr:hypothetical protein BD769DRAFT_1497754 [Suillus cothurnatus]